MYFNSGSSCCSNMNMPFWGASPCCGYNSGNNSSFAIILVLFILLVIVIGSRYTH